MKGQLHPRVALAVLKRDLRRNFNNPAGYVFVTFFILLSAAAAFWQRRFFLNNLANLDQLNHVFPLLLLLFVPALTMGMWSEERKQGTDELLLTLPGSELDVVVGKYLAAVGIYSLSLVLSVSHALVLVWLGRPDIGLLAANYFAYWLAGIATIAVAMAASIMTANMTIAYVLGSMLCALPVLGDRVAAVFSKKAGELLEPFGLSARFLEVASGVISFSGLFYFVSLAACGLYVNVILLSRRHWSGDRALALHRLARATALLIAVSAADVLMDRVPLRIDTTAEKLHSLSPETLRLMSALPADRQVLIRAFVSPDVPELYVQTRENLLSALHEITAAARGNVQVLVTDVRPYSDEARTARERFGIAPRVVNDLLDPGAARDGIFLGVAFTSGAEEQVIPFLERGLSIEYEIVRAVRVVARAGRKRIGVINTDAKVLGGLDAVSGRPRAPWAVIAELAKQYELVSVAPSVPIQEKVDALLVALPSTLLQDEMDHVKQAVQHGVPTLLIVDPVTSMDMRLSPAAAMFARVDPYRSDEPLTQKNVGNVQQMTAEMGFLWQPARIVWDSYNPHPEMAQMPREVVFIAPGSGSAAPFNRHHPATAGLQELLLMYPGYLQSSGDEKFEFEPLLRTSKVSGTLGYFQLVQPTPQGPVVNTAIVHEPQAKEEYVLAAHIHPRPGKSKVNAIVIADLDFISDQFFDIRAMGSSNANFDNVTFFLNCMDVLAGDRSLIDLRNRRPRHRTLDRIEAQTRTFAERRGREEHQAELDAQKALADARARLDKRVQAIQRRANLDEQAKQIMTRNLQEVENRRLDVLATNIDVGKQARIQASRERMEAEVRVIQGTIRTMAVALPPIPVLVMGIAIFVRRRRRERRGAAALRRLRDSDD